MSIAMNGSLTLGRRTALILLALVTLLAVMVIPKRAFAADYTTQNWQTVEISLTSSKTYADPFANVDVTATFTGPGGTVITRPAFWNGGSVWKIRFAPTKTGAWSMTTSANDPTDTGLNGITKSIQVNAYTGSLDIYKKGFLKVSSNGRYLTYNDGTPFFYLGDTHWILPHERFSTSNATGIASQFKYVVDKRVSQGFTVYQSEPIWQPHGGGTHTGSDEEAVANLSDGFTSADLAGFDNLDRKFKYIADQGLVHANAQVSWAQDPANYSVYTDAYMARVAKYWVARFGSYPLIYTIAQEIDRNMYGAYNATTMSKWYAVGQSISDNDAYGQPIMPHMENTGTSVASNSTWASKSYHDGWAVQWQGDLTGMSTAKDFYNFSTAKPSVLYESAYDGFWTDSTGALGAAYKAFQYGIYGYGYGASGVWNDVYSKTGEADDFGTGYELPSRYTWWYDGANYATGSQLTYFKSFYTSLEWWKLVPRFDDAAWGSFSDTSRSLLSSDGNSTYVTFFFNGTTSTGTIKGMDNGYYYDAKWFNPRTGAYTAISTTAKSTSGQWNVPSKPDTNDWVLLLKKTSAPVPASTNLALGKTYASSSSWDSSQTADKAFDGLLTTDWQACNTCWNGQTLEVNFGASTTFNRVVLSEYDNRTTGYRIEYWNGSTWQTAYTGTGIGSSKTITFPSVTASKARIYFTSGTANAPIIYEFEIYNDVVNLALGKTYASSSTWDGTQTADKAFDGSLSTNWQACSSCWNGQTLEVNFGANTTFNKVVLTEYDSRTTGYRIEYWNGSTWQTAYTGTSIGASFVPKTITFSAVTGSKARIYFTSGTSYAPIIYEFEVYNQ
ncbi:DUF4038 domain-containing protein [Paenibacillus sacheonensis]|uniref:DUF4038 domain-containing protein n=1 Tax=Paenibacillus sacheonensis TaxID=742054 RepID=A0A7X4YN06_9BACL|nr:DUF4038 domain-containing protein [Paenibacillus sacheonensis]MBM7564834.1 hypothetical protein [Paenibacillus sacheonensis]NBC69382.1 DUF4038 domain-containing protein [Paenibacillus sacheonensis]